MPIPVNIRKDPTTGNLIIDPQQIGGGNSIIYATEIMFNNASGGPVTITFTQLLDPPHVPFDPITQVVLPKGTYVDFPITANVAAETSYTYTVSATVMAAATTTTDATGIIIVDPPMPGDGDGDDHRKDRKSEREMVGAD
jgi:hypothetical protein